MKLAEAAHILGISLEEVTIDSLKKTYKTLITPIEKEKVSCRVSVLASLLPVTSYFSILILLSSKGIFKSMKLIKSLSQ
jgi:hypothetical protein